MSHAPPHTDPRQPPTSCTSASPHRDALERQLKELDTALRKHRHNYINLTAMLIQELRALSTLRFLEMADGGACRHCSLFQVTAYNMHDIATHGQQVSSPVPHSLCVVPPRAAHAVEAQYALTLRPASPNVSLVLPSIDEGDGVASHQDVPLVFQIDIGMHMTMPKTAVQAGSNGAPRRGATNSSVAEDTDMLTVRTEVLSVLSGCAPVSDHDLMMSGQYVVRDLAECSTNGVSVKFVVHSTAVDDRNRVRPIAVLDSVVFTTESILTSDDTPRWPMYIAKCLEPRIPQLHKLLCENYGRIVELLYGRQRVQLALFGGDADGYRRNMHISSRLPYRLDTAQPLQVHASRGGSASSMRNRFGAEPGEEDSSCVVC